MFSVAAAPKSRSCNPAPTGEVNGWQPLENPAAGAAAPLAAVASEVDAILAAWRERVLRILLAVYLTITLVPLAAVLAGRGMRVKLAQQWSIAVSAVLWNGRLAQCWQFSKKSGGLGNLQKDFH